MDVYLSTRQGAYSLGCDKKQCVHLLNSLAPGSRDMHTANNKAINYLFRALCQSEFDQVFAKDLACRIWDKLKVANVGNNQVEVGSLRLTRESTRTSLISLASP
jgi:hypothetical protein